MVETKVVTCKVLMGALFYTLGEVIRVNDEFKEKVKDINVRIQWDIGGGPKAYLIIEKNTVKAEIGSTIDDPNLKINITDVDSALGLFTGKMSMETSPDKIKMDPKEKANELMFILTYLRKYFESIRLIDGDAPPQPAEDNVAQKKITVKTLAYLILCAHEEISKVDEDFEEELMDFDDAVIQWKIGDDIFGYFRTEDGQARFTMDAEHENPTLRIIIPNIDNAIDIFTGRIPSMKAYMRKMLDVEGNLDYIQRMAMATQTVTKYLKILLE